MYSKLFRIWRISFFRFNGFHWNVFFSGFFRRVIDELLQLVRIFASLESWYQPSKRLWFQPTLHSIYTDCSGCQGWVLAS